MTTPRVHENVIIEAFAGAHDAIERQALLAGGWLCEQHPTERWPHGTCPGPGYLPSERER